MGTCLVKVLSVKQRSLPVQSTATAGLWSVNFLDHVDRTSVSARVPYCTLQLCVYRMCLLHVAVEKSGCLDNQKEPSFREDGFPRQPGEYNYDINMIKHVQGHFKFWFKFEKC